MIQLIRAELYSYRCIEEPQTLEFEKGITALTGSNEAGKTTVLQSLAKANYFDSSDGQFRYDPGVDYPRRLKRELEAQKQPPLAAKLTYRVSAPLLDQIRADMLLREQTDTFSRITNYAGGRQVVDSGFEYDTHAFWTAYAAQRAPSLQPWQKNLAGLHNLAELDSFRQRYRRELGDAELEALRAAEKYLQNPRDWDNPLNEYVFRTWLMPHIPQFMYYDECRVMPSRLSVDRLLDADDLTATERTAKALLLVAELDLEKLARSESLDSCQTEIEVAQANLTRKLLRYWKSNPNLSIELKVSREMIEPAKKRGFFRKPIPAKYQTILEICAKDEQSLVSLPLENRSKGFNWFFSFWAWFMAIEQNTSSSYFLLLDEPGLHLHEDAQRDLVDFIKHLSGKYQILYTTHSPYMMEGRRYHVVNGEGGSVISLKEGAE